jgi:hypothetical protein
MEPRPYCQGSGRHFSHVGLYRHARHPQFSGCCDRLTAGTARIGFSPPLSVIETAEGTGGWSVPK